MASFIVDTNFFLQCKSPAELQWSAITPDAEVLLLVTYAVHRELDDLKQDGSSRRARRARTACGLLREALRADDTGHSLRDSGPAVRLVLLGDRARPPADSTLDMTRVDDQLVAEALARGIPLLSYDGGPLRTARFHGAQFEMIPENWLLDPEPNRESKEIAKLKERVAVLEESGPTLALELLDSQGARLSEIEIVLPLVSPSDDDVDGAMQLLASRFPLADFPSQNSPAVQIMKLPGLGQAIPPSTADFEGYRLRYQTWLVEAREALFEALLHLIDQGRRKPLRVRISNNGHRSGERVNVELFAHDLLRFGRPNEETQPMSGPTLPPAPRAPQFRLKPWFPEFTALGRLSADAFGPRFDLDLPTIQPRDEFGWTETENQFLECHCTEFPHQLDAQELEFELVAPQEECNSHLRLRVSASNLPTPTERVVKVSVRFESRDTAATLREIIEKWPSKD